MQDNDLEFINDYIDGLIGKLKPDARRKLAQELARKFRKENQKRITRQVEPSGKRFAERKKKKIKKKMFLKLKTARFLKTQATPNSATVFLTDKVSKMARVHQYGLRGRILRTSAKTTTYPKRELIGFSASDLQMIDHIMLEHLERGIK